MLDLEAAFGAAAIFRPFAGGGSEMRAGVVASVIGLSAIFAYGPDPAAAQAAPAPVTPASDFNALCRSVADEKNPPYAPLQRVVCADLAALDQTLVYNRFGSFDPFAMIFALRRDLAPLNSPLISDGLPPPLTCEDDIGNTEGGAGPSPVPGEVRLKDCKRPRPLTLRANVGDWLLVRVSNFLTPQTGTPAKPRSLDLVSDFCDHTGGNDRGRAAVRHAVSKGMSTQVGKHDEATCPHEIASHERGVPGDWPATRGVNFVVQGLMPEKFRGEVNAACTGFGAAAPGEAFVCLYRISAEGTHFLASHAAPAGGEGDGGSITHGLFGGILAERPGSRWYRSQVSRKALDEAWPPATNPKVRHVRQHKLVYETMHDGVPVLDMARVLDTPQDAKVQTDVDTATALELVHNDLNAIIYCSANSAAAKAAQPAGCNYHEETSAAGSAPATGAETAGPKPYPKTMEPDFRAFREFTVFFHDELKTYYTRNFDDLKRFGQLAGVRDGFAINYGSSGMGALLLANRKGIGPAAACMECLYEEFFLTSWANGDPALLEWFDDDPSNVHHSYLNDPVVFRNFHAGPKETHVFHLHAHQWFAGNDPARGSYLDSQTVAPQQGFTYNIYRGGLGEPGGWKDGGSGNRNRTIGDSIFHCHLYPHFAQGMWSLWRVHDVLEDGTRLLPDGQETSGLSINLVEPGRLNHKRTGSVDRQTGRWLAADVAGTPEIEGAGTPIPALVPLPGEPLPPLPSYLNGGDVAQQASLTPGAPADGGPERLFLAQAGAAPAATAEKSSPMPGYPFYIAGQPGHRPPQAPMDIARDPDNPAMLLSGGLGRHVVGDATRALGVTLPPAVAAHATALAAAMQPPENRANDPARQELEALRSQLVAKALALGDMTGRLEAAKIETLDPEGNDLERGAMAFHADGKRGGTKLSLHDVYGAPLEGQTTVDGHPSGGYASPRAPFPDDSPSAAAQPSLFQVNGSPPRPGAPFADPCGGAAGRDGTQASRDPLMDWPVDEKTEPYAADRDLFGFRRYEVSAVQLDLIVNKAGWHDPQARIDVLTDGSDVYKAGTGRFSPVVSDNEEPFFFRALSGECIEFRHTNELPKDLELDDFQVKTPTDTIGQHIHLVKFDVTSSDGSGNGWNYEDGTLAPDEILARRCAAQAAGSTFNPAWGSRAPTKAECDMTNVWRLPLSTHRDLFQTTVQRWFADPMLTSTEGGGLLVDRTMRTVFSHDHFGPSSIQQHGFYTALLIEPSIADRKPDGPQDAKLALHQICRSDKLTKDEKEEERCIDEAELHKAGEVVESDGKMVGASKALRMKYPKDSPENARNTPQNIREFALAVADFAVLYDPRDREAVESVGTGENAKGMARLLCEAAPTDSQSGASLARRIAACGTGLEKDPAGYWFARLGHVPPAWQAEGRPGDDRQHRNFFTADLIEPKEVADLREHLVNFRLAAAGRPGDAFRGIDHLPDGDVLAKPVAPPERPESISVDHHDPYVLNYRNAPVPLRVGTDLASGAWSNDCRLFPMTRPGLRGQTSEVETQLIDGTFPPCSFTYQRTAKADGDMSMAFSSWSDRTKAYDRDPETPILEAYQGETLMFRLIQGAQEVQHNFNIAGVPFRRNVDQVFPQGMRDRSTLGSSYNSPCFEAVRNTKVTQYNSWKDGEFDAEDADAYDAKYWKGYENAIANCDNLEGFTFSREIGISEHFEMDARLRADVYTAELAEPNPQPDPDAPPTKPTNEGDPHLSDFLVNFGSLDSLWNGAWGLTRIYKDKSVRDPLNSAAAIGDRLVPASQSYEAALAEGQPPLASTTCPLPAGRDVTRTEAIIVAIENRKIDAWRNRTYYGDNEFDPDGLTLALLPPSALGITDIYASDIPLIKRTTVLKAIATAYPRSEPFVLRVNAGDCVVLRYVNMLEETAPGAGMNDELGDALAPQIAPLNLDPVPSVDAEKRLLTLEAPAGVLTGLRPSASLGLSIGLPSAELVRYLPLGYGRSRLPLGPSTGDTVAVGGVIDFYAGRVIPKSQASILGLAGNLLKDAVVSELADRLKGDAPELVDRLQLNAGEMALVADDKTPLFHFLGEGVSVKLPNGNDSIVVAAQPGTPPTPFVARLADLTAFCVPHTECPLSAAEMAMIQRAAIGAAAYAIDEQMKWVPYAFGPTPVRATGDLISHAPHGLFGIIDVVPASWDLDGTGALSKAPTASPLVTAAVENAMTGHDSGKLAFRSAAHVPGFGAPLRVAVRSDPLQDDTPVTPVEENKPRHLTEAVLFFQDGLNLWDDYSELKWSWKSGNHGTIPPLVPDCLICDDSYDRGEQGVNYRSPAYVSLLRDTNVLDQAGHAVEVTTDLNSLSFPSTFFAPTDTTVWACAGDQVVLRAVHPGGRARQHAFTMNGYSYDDLFPGFGFPHSALLGPGKSASAWLSPTAVPGMRALWLDGPRFLAAGGIWGAVETKAKDTAPFPGAAACPK